MTHRARSPRLFFAALVLAGALLLLPAASVRAEAPQIIVSDAAVEQAWIGGAPPITVEAVAQAGVRYVSVTLDGVSVAFQSYECHDGWSVPCPQSVAVYDNLPTTGLADGPHALSVEASDSFGNLARHAATVRVDNHAPAAPAAVAVENGTGWRADPARRLTWTNPSQPHAPLAGAGYRLCPAEADSADPQTAARGRAGCVSKQLTAAQLASGSLAVDMPAPGLWSVRLWLVDAAGNANPDAGAVVKDLGFDPTPPEVSGFVAQDPNDPARVTVAASDDVAPLADGAIEYRRRGSDAWHPLPTEIRSTGISAVVDDERLRQGRYRLRATVANAAGLQHGTDESADGAKKSMRLPIREASRLAAGRPVGTVCHRQGKARRCQARLARRVTVAHGRGLTLRARLKSGGRPLAHERLEVWELVSVTGAGWRQVGAVETDGRGRARYEVAKGPARKLRFRYPGTSLMRGESSTVSLRVPARTTFDVSRRSVINGEYVMFSGRVRGRPIPTTGLLVELQVRSRGRWRTFAQPRARVDGAWRYQYRFETVSGGARFRFRARVRRQSGYPYTTGTSRVIGVKVHGL